MKYCKCGHLAEMHWPDCKVEMAGHMCMCEEFMAIKLKKIDILDILPIKSIE